MTSKFNSFRVLLLLLLAGCTLAPTQPALPMQTVTLPLPAETPSAMPTASPEPPPTQTRTPPALPAPYQSSFLYAGDSAHTYVSETCQYLKDRWSTGNASPGTVVMVIMFHAIGGETSGDRIAEADFRLLMQALQDQGFEAITTAQLADFMEHNAFIPPRSVVLLVDDRKTGLYYETFFREYQQAWGWPVVNAWISLDDSIGRAALPDNVVLENEGWVDHQAHGVVHNITMGPEASEAYITSELQGSIDALQAKFNKTPQMIIWPGGNFSLRAVQIARELGYRLGFTVNPRGPLMYNWVPLADSLDPQRPTWWAEGGMGDPLLVLPRYWAPDARRHIGNVIEAGSQAAAYAQASRSLELDYYDIVCAAQYGALP